MTTMPVHRSMRTNLDANRITTVLLMAIVAFSFPNDVLGGDNSHIYWVSRDGAATWADCESVTPLSGPSACTMSTANTSAIAGDTINIRGGTYNTSIRPSRSGTAGNKIVYRGYGGEAVTITNVGSSGGIQLSGVDYIKISDVTVANTFQLMNITGGSDYNEISGCTLHTGTAPANSGVNIFTINVREDTKNTNNWVHHCTIYEGGYINPGCDDAGGLVNIGADLTYDGLSDHNTFEDNVIYWGAHHALKTNTRYNVIRNNFIHNEGHFVATSLCKATACAPDGLYGNRVVTILNNHAGTPEWFSNTYNLIENNRIGSAGLASDGNGADGLTLGGEKDIARFNTIFNAQEVGVYLRESGELADYNRVYNNTIAYNGQGPQCRVDSFPGFWKGGVRVPSERAEYNALKNNIIFGNGAREWWDKGTGTITAGNWFSGDGDPQFMDVRMSFPSSASVPDLSLRPASGAIDNGTFLTQADGAGANSRTLRVDDALYFQYGERGSSLAKMQADWIAIGTVSNAVQIASINYDTKTITLAAPLTWGDRAPVWLLRDSDGTEVLRGKAPDQGAHEFQSPKAATNPRIIR